LERFRIVVIAQRYFELALLSYQTQCVQIRCDMRSTIEAVRQRKLHVALANIGQ